MIWIEQVNDRHNIYSNKVMKLPKQQTSIIVWTYVQIFMIVETADAHMTA